MGIAYGPNRQLWVDWQSSAQSDRAGHPRPPGHTRQKEIHMHAPHQKRLGLAGIATMNGSRKRGSNTVLRSGRQRRKGFEKEAGPVIRAFETRYPDFPKPQSADERNALCASHAHFAVFCGQLDALAAKWGV
jgi:hypothetical protein